MPSTYTVERRATIAAPPAAVYERIIDFHRWPAWSPWEDLDPEMDKKFEGSDAGVGAVYEWSGNRKVGQGRMEIIGANEPEQVTIDLQFVKPFKSHNNTTFTLEPKGDATEVIWTMVAPHTTMSRVMGVFMNFDKMVGKDFEKGLDRLKADVESA